MNKIVFLLFLLFPVTIFPQVPRLVMPVGHTKPITEITQSGNNKIIATSSLDQTIKVWEANTTRLLLTYSGNYDNLYLTYNGSFLVADTLGGPSKIWDLVNDSIVKIPALQQPINIVISPNSKFLVALFDDSLNIYDLDSKTLVISNKKRFNKYCSPVFSFDNKRLLYSTIGEAYTTDIELLDLNSLSVMQKIQTSLSLYELKYISDNLCLASNGSDVKIFDLQMGNIKLNPPRLSKIKSFDITQDGKFLAIASNDSTIRIYDINEGKIINELKTNEGIFTLKCNNDINEILLSGFKAAFLWNWKENRVTAKTNFNNSLYAVYASSYCNNYKNVVLGIDNFLIVADKSLATGTFRTFGKKIKNIDFEVFDPTSTKLYSRMFTPGEPADDKILSLASGKLITRLKPSNWVIDPFSPDGKFIFQYVRPYSKDPVSLIDAATGKISQQLDTYSYDYGIFSPDKKYYFIAEDFINLQGRKTYMRSAKTFEHLYEFKPSVSDVLNASFSNHGKMIALPSQNKVYVYSTAEGKFLYSLSSPADSITTALFTSNDSLLVTNSVAGNVISWNARTGKRLHYFERMVEPGSFFKPDAIVNSRILITSNPDTIFGYNLLNGKIDYKIFSDKIIKLYKILPRYNKIAVIYYNNDTLFIYDARNGTPDATIPGKFSSVTSIESNDSSVLICGYDNGNVQFHNLNSGAIMNSVLSHHAPVKAIVLSPNNKLASTISDDCTSKIWDVSKGNLLFTFASIDSSYIIIILGNYYMGDIQSIKKLHFENKLKTIGFEQLDVKYNRPDKVIEYLNSYFGETDSVLIDAYRHAYYKRVKKTGIDTASFQDSYDAPEADFTNRDAIEYEQKNNKLTLSINGIDSNYSLTYFNMWVNEVPVFGVKGINVKYRSKKVFDTTITITLSEGENKIETSVINSNGIESYRNPLYVKYASAKPEKQRIYFLGIGIDRFADSTNNLRWSVKDIRDLALHLKEKYKDAIEIDTLFNENVTISKVKALKVKLQHTSVNDKVIVAYSGHGLLSKDYDYYLSTYNVNFNQPEQNGLPYEELENLLDSIPARKKLMLIDACHSGEIDMDEMQQYTTAQNKLDSVKGVILANKDSSRIGMKNSFELMQELFVNVGKSTGATIISAASGTQFALEKSDLKNGVFTYSILEYMKQHEHANLSALKQYVNTRVPQLTQGLQQPTSRSETIDVDWDVW